MVDTMKESRTPQILGLAVALLVQGCAGFTPTEPTHYPPRPAQEDRQPAPHPAKVEEPRQVDSIAADFSHQAEKQRRQGNLDMAAATLERGLRLAPKDPFLWSQLAEVRLQQNNYQQARTLAAKSSSLAGSNSTITNKNNWIIHQAMQLGGAATN